MTALTGKYRLDFDTDVYFARLGTEAFFPGVQVRCLIRVGVRCVGRGLGIWHGQSWWYMVTAPCELARTTRF